MDMYSRDQVVEMLFDDDEDSGEASEIDEDLSFPLPRVDDDEESLDSPSQSPSSPPRSPQSPSPSPSPPSSRGRGRGRGRGRRTKCRPHHHCGW